MAQSYAPRSGGTRERESGPDVIVCVRALSSQVDLAAVARALKSGHLGGAAVDVYPKEPSRNGTGFETDLHGCPNVILTPHIGTLRRSRFYSLATYTETRRSGTSAGGSTEEAQRAIGVEVATAMIRFVDLERSPGVLLHASANPLPCFPDAGTSTRARPWGPSTFPRWSCGTRTPRSAPCGFSTSTRTCQACSRYVLEKRPHNLSCLIMLARIFAWALAANQQAAVAVEH